MPTLPRATTTVRDTAGAVATGLDLICVWAPVPSTDDITPRLFGRAADIYALHGYSEGVEYAALHVEQTQQPILFVGLPIDTAGAITSDAVGETPALDVVAGADGALVQHEGTVEVVTGGTVGTSLIALRYTLDGGRVWKPVRVGLGTSYVIPYVGATITLESGASLSVGDTVTWAATGPKSASTDWALARAALAAQQRGFRSVLLVGDVADATAANAFAAQINAYETANDRFVYGRASVYDRGEGQTIPVWANAVDAAFAAVAGQPRLDLSMGRARVLSPLTGWNFRVPAAWLASLREYQHDLHITTWWKALGPLPGASLLDAEGNVAEYDDAVHGAVASIGGFTSLRSWSNGPSGAYVSQSLTRATEGSLLGHTSNRAVVNLACTTVQLNVENSVGRTLELNDNGTATTASLLQVQSEVNAALELALLTDTRNEGARASKAVFTPSTDDVFNVAEPVLTGVLDLVLNGIIHSVEVSVRIRSGGQA
jgi:hypothetical protein